MEDSAKTLLFSFALFSLFAVLIITIVNDQGALYGKDTTQITGGALNMTSLNSVLNNVSTTSDNLRESFGKQNIFVTLGNLVISGFFGIANSMIQLIIAPFSILNGILTNIIGVPAIVTGTLTALLGFAIIFAVWRLIKFGD